MKKQTSTLLPALLDLLRQYLALDMAVYAGHATLLLLTASLPLLMWVLMLVNRVPGFSVEGVAELLADFLPQIPEIQTAILGLLQNLSGQSAQFVASLAVLTTIVSASGGMNALQIGLQRLTPGSGGQHWPDRLGPAAVRAAFADLHLRPRRAAHAAQPAAGHDLCNGGVAGLLPCVLVLHRAFLASVVYLRLADGGHSDYFVAVCDHQSAVSWRGIERGDERKNGAMTAAA